MPVIGIDFGSESFYVAAIRSGEVEILTNDIGDRMTPSFVSFGERNLSFGSAARSSLTTNLPNTIYGFKRLLGARANAEFTCRETSYLSYPIFQEKEGDFTGMQVSYLNQDWFITVTQIMAMFLVKIKELAETKLKDKVTGCVLSVPSFFGNDARLALLDAASIANLTVLQFLNEPTAAALFYTYQRLSQFPKEYINAVFLDMGQTSLQISACILTTNGVETVRRINVMDVGGRDFDNCIADHFISKFKRDYDLDVKSNSHAILNLVSQCEKVKKQLSACALSFPFTIDCFMEGKDVGGDLDRQTMKELCKSLLNKVKIGMKDFLQHVEGGASSIELVELVGGAARIPAIKSLVKKIFKCEAKTTLNMDEAVVSGCSLQAAILSQNIKTKPFVINDVQIRPIKLVYSSGTELMENDVFPVNHPIPFSKFVSCPMTPGEFTLDAYYGKPKERIKPEDFIGSYTIKEIPSLPSGKYPEVIIKCRIDVYGIFTIVSAKVLDEEDYSIEIDQNKENLLDITNASFRNKVEENQENGPKTSNGQYLPIEVHDSRLSRAKLDEFSKIQAAMTQLDAKENMRLESSNNLEEYIYSFRDALREELAPYVTERENKEIHGMLKQLEDWLSDEGKKAPIEEYNHYLQLLEGWRQEFEDCRNALECIENFRMVTKKVEAILNLQSKRDFYWPRASISDIAMARDNISARRQWLDESAIKILKENFFSSDEVEKEQASFLKVVTELLGVSEKKVLDFELPETAPV